MKLWSDLTSPKFWLKDVGGLIVILTVVSPVTGLLSVLYPDHVFLIAAIGAGFCVTLRAVGWRIYRQRRDDTSTG